MGDAGRRGLVRWAAGLSIAAALIHGALVGEHLREWWGYGLFFLVAAAVQLVYGLVLLVAPWRYDATGALRPDDRAGRPIFLAGAAGTASVVALYVVTRTAGIPLLGPEAGRVEPVTPVGLVSKAIEVALVACLVALARRDRTVR